MNISFTDIDIILKDELKEIAKRAIHDVLIEKKGEINIVSCSDEYILAKNNEILKHNYYTDIITFYYNPKDPTEEVDLLISIERIMDNSKTNNVELIYEFARVIIHGCLHLLGYNDKTNSEKMEMRNKEDYFLKRLFHVEQ